MADTLIDGLIGVLNFIVTGFQQSIQPFIPNPWGVIIGELLEAALEIVDQLLA